MTKKIVINEKNLVQDDSWLNFRKVRAIIENKKGEIIVSNEGGIYIFPGGKCDGEESEELAIKREIEEETGIKLTDEFMEKILEIEAFYDDFYDFRSDSIKPRHMLTTYFHVKTKKKIDTNKLKLTTDEKKLGFNIFTCSKNNLYKLLNEDHSLIRNGKFFDEENKVVLEEIFMQKKR